MTAFAGGPADSPGFLLWRGTLRWQRAVAEALRPLDLTHVQFVLLASIWWLSQHGRTFNQLAIASHAAIDVKMTSEVLRRLEEKGLVLQQVDPQDRRAKVVTATLAGSALAERAVVVVEQVDHDFFGDAPETLVQALRVLAGVAPELVADAVPDPTSLA